MGPDDPRFLLFGGACLLGSLLTYLLGYRRCAKRYDAICTVPTIATRDIPGLGAAMVEVKGDVRADAPLISDLARIPCVVFNCSVTEHWTTTETQRDSKGNTRRVTKHHSETRYSNSGQIDFRVDDGAGEVTVHPDGASIDLLDGMGNLDGPRPESPAYHISPRHFGGRLRYSESVLPVGERVYVLAQVKEDHSLGQATDFDRPFIISHRSEAELCSSALWGKRIGAVAALVLLVAGLVLALEGERLFNPQPTAPVHFHELTPEAPMNEH